ncbi:LuxR C-terminal-related transcriptional regulator [Streptomyces roseoverticillatus]|uniref:LuxR C-terminal-related transcriptional regulator n=1 Tax=Streptomyces roseoverticillatus TaxID=66429 RepID=UPI00340B0FEC
MGVMARGDLRVIVCGNIRSERSPEGWASSEVQSRLEDHSRLEEIALACTERRVDAVLLPADTLTEEVQRRSVQWRRLQGLIERWGSHAITSTLTPRERHAFYLLGEGRSNEQIAEEMGITVRTTKAHIGKILEKTGVETRLQAGLAAYACRLLEACQLG